MNSHTVSCGTQLLYAIVHGILIYKRINKISLLIALCFSRCKKIPDCQSGQSFEDFILVSTACPPIEVNSLYSQSLCSKMNHSNRYLWAHQLNPMHLNLKWGSFEVNLLKKEYNLRKPFIALSFFTYTDGLFECHLFKPLNSLTHFTWLR